MRKRADWLNQKPEFLITIEDNKSSDSEKSVVLELTFPFYFKNRFGQPDLYKESVKVVYCASFDGDFDGERQVDCSGWSAEFDSAYPETLSRFYSSIYRKLDLNGGRYRGEEELVDLLRERIEELLKTFKPRKLQKTKGKQVEILRGRSAVDSVWNPYFQKRVRVGGRIVTTWKSGTPGSTTNNYQHAKLVADKKLTTREIKAIEKATGVKNGCCMKVSAPRVEQTGNKFSYEWSYNNGTD